MKSDYCFKNKIKLNVRKLSELNWHQTVLKSVLYFKPGFGVIVRLLATQKLVDNYSMRARRYKQTHIQQARME